MAGPQSHRKGPPGLFNIKFTYWYSSFVTMPRRRKHCAICGKRSLRLANHLADVHELSIEEKQPYLIRAKTTPVDLKTILTELCKLIRNKLREQAKWYK